jgi:hypothetical protein
MKGKAKTMRRLILPVAMLLMITASASAFEAEKLRGAAADAFIAKYFPNAAIPGPFKGEFTYTNKKGEQTRGLAKCLVPAMGARSDGAVSMCKVLY